MDIFCDKRRHSLPPNNPSNRLPMICDNVCNGLVAAHFQRYALIRSKNEGCRNIIITPHPPNIRQKPWRDLRKTNHRLTNKNHRRFVRKNKILKSNAGSRITNTPNIPKEYFHWVDEDGGPWYRVWYASLVFLAFWLFSFSSTS